MADQKITQLSSLTNSTVDVADVLPIVDVSVGATDKMTYQNLMRPKDSIFGIVGSSDTTKIVAFEVDGLTTGTTRTVTIPDADLTMVGVATTQTLTNKTLTSPVINLGTNATGDMYYRDSGGAFQRLPIGTASQTIQVSAGGIPEWIANPAASDASTTVKGVSEIATVAEITAGTATGGTGATLVVPASAVGAVAASSIVQFTAATKYPAADGSLITNISGVAHSVNADETLNTYSAVQVPMLITGTVDVMPGWVLTNITAAGGSIGQAGGYTNLQGSTSADFVISTSLPGANGGSNANYTPADTRAIRLKWRVRLDDLIDRKGFGFCVTPANIHTAETDTTAGEVRFIWNAGVLWAQNANGTTTKTDISSGITGTNWNLYEIVFTPGTDIKYYINGTLKATHTTNLPTTGTLVLAMGANANGRVVQTNFPILSIQN